jgi:glycine/D-amino acid oxidase-like deaminating enzyme
MKRRSILKSISVASFGVLAPEVLAKPYEVKVEKTSTEVLIVGGGTAGTIAAIQAGRLGVKTILIESGSQLGGSTTTGGVAFPGIFHAWGKQIIGGIGWELVMDCVELNGDELPNFSKIPDRHWKHQVTLNASLYTLLAEEKCLEAGVDIRYYESPTKVEFKKGKWIVESVGKGTKTIIVCDQIIDCTGNALIASMAGYDVLREEYTQPGSLVFRLGGYSFESLDLHAIPSNYQKVLRQNMLENSVRSSKEHNYVPYSYVYVPGADSTTSATHTAANNEGRKALLKLVRELKALPGCENLKIIDLKTETAVRETYRIDGLYKVVKEDYTSGKVFDDAISYSFYPIDLHREGKTIYQEFLKPGVVASIPLRSLIPKRSKNFLVAGRCVSSDRLANSALRVQASCMGMGQAAAVAAVLALRQGVSPEQVDINKVKEILKKNGAIIPNNT